MNNRELATLILLATFALLALAIRDVRGMLPSLAKQLFLSKLTPLMLVFVAVEVGAIWLAAGFSLWSPDLLGGTILWFLLVGFVWFVSLGEAGKDPDFFKRRLLETLSVTAFHEFFVNAQVMPLPVELIAQIFLLLVVSMNVVALNHKEYKPVANLTSGIIILSTLGLLTYSVTHVISNWPALDKRELVNELLMPVWLSGVAVSVLYPIAFYMGYELLFVRLSFLHDGRKPSVRARAGMAGGLRGSLVDINQFRGPPARDAAQSTTARAAYEAVRLFKKERAEDLAARAATRRKLVKNAGRRGVDEDRRLLDRREFAETKEALRWLAICHMGWYRNEDRPEKYRPDLLEVLRDSRQFEFETEEPIVSKVRKDGHGSHTARHRQVTSLGSAHPDHLHHSGSMMHRLHRAAFRAKHPRTGPTGCGATARSGTQNLRPDARASGRARQRVRLTDVRSRDGITTTRRRVDTEKLRTARGHAWPDSSPVTCQMEAEPALDADW